MKNKKVLFVLVSILFSLTMMFSFSFSAFATGEPYNPDAEVTSEPFSEEVTEPYTEAPTEEVTEAPTQEQTEEQSEESTESYTQSEVDTLPEVESGEVVVPTAEEFPEFEVSDISLLGGVISWLCVAVGIAVIAGVLVSQRTKQVSNHRDNRRR